MAAPNDPQNNNLFGLEVISHINKFGTKTGAIDCRAEIKVHNISQQSVKFAAIADVFKCACD